MTEIDADFKSLNTLTFSQPPECQAIVSFGAKLRFSSMAPVNEIDTPAYLLIGYYWRSKHKKSIKSLKPDSRQSLTVAYPAISFRGLLVVVNWSVNWFACVHRIR